MADVSWHVPIVHRHLNISPSPQKRCYPHHHQHFGKHGSLFFSPCVHFSFSSHCTNLLQFSIMHTWLFNMWLRSNPLHIIRLLQSFSPSCPLSRKGVLYNKRRVVVLVTVRGAVGTLAQCWRHEARIQADRWGPTGLWTSGHIYIMILTCCCSPGGRGSEIGRSIN